MRKLTINKVMKTARKITDEKGFRSEMRPIATDVALMHSELSEALEEIRNGNGADEVYIKDHKPEGFPIELADCIIRICETCSYWNIDLEAAIRIKLNFNKSRPHKHGGKIF